jgi:tungstate transport system substrate-binding protein
MKRFKLTVLLGVLLLAGNINAAETILRMSTTTSTADSGLLDVLNPVFEKQQNARLEVIAVGSGKALKLAENGDVDIVFAHAPEAEIAFVNAGFGVDRSAVMHNDFIIVGPEADKAGVKKALTAVQAFRSIAQSQSEFISRGDDSGTEKKEGELWRDANIKPQGEWYISAGQGMGAVLEIADEKQAYTLSDRGTFISYQAKLDLVLLFEGDPALINPYHIIAVNPKRHAHVQYQLAKRYIEFVTGKEGQAIIRAFKKGGQQLFFPDVLK